MAFWHPLEVLLGSPKPQVLPTRSGSSENVGREKGEDRNKVLPNDLGSQSVVGRHKGLVWGSPEAEGWYSIFWEDGEDAPGGV